MASFTRRMMLLLTTVLLSSFGEPVVAAEKTPPDDADTEFFERKVRPLLVQHCYSCHARGQKKGGLSLANRAGLLAGGESGAVVALGKPAESSLIAAVEQTGDVQMPPNGKLSKDEIAVLRKWVELGAPWPESATKDGGGIRAAGVITDEDRQFWSFRPVRASEPPAVRDVAWPRRAIDHFVLAQLEASGLKPVAEADRRTLIRRATFDLIGLPPTVEEVEAFVADEHPQAYERLIDHLLQSPHYGERWARHWLDVARYGEDQAHTFAARMYPSGFRYRDWVVSSFNNDLPYDRFIVEQIAGDLLPSTEETDRLKRLPALGYFALGPVYYADAGCAGKAQADEIDDRVDTLTRGFLGLTVSCARCHDHKFDPIPTQDYYALAGVFASSQYREAPLAPDDVVKQYDERAKALKDFEKKLADSQTAEARKFGESLAPQVAKYVVGSWKLQNRRKKENKFAIAKVAEELGLNEFILERWIQFLTPDTVRQKPYLIALKQALEGQDAATDLADDAAALAVVEKAGVTLQEQFVAALRTRDEHEGEYARKVAEAPEAEKSKVAKPKLEQSQADLLKDLLTDNKAPLLIPKERFEKLLPDASNALLTEMQKEQERLKKELGEKYPVAHSLTENKPTNLKVHLRGNHKELGDEVPRRFLAILSPNEAAPFREGSGRLELAKSIADPANPLTARVMVNRVWQNHFGRGLVGTPSNFGLLGERPTHPELLDYLAAQFMTSGWSIKQLHREIMLSATYRMQSGESGAQNTEATTASADPDNRLLWRQNRRRLDIESWRDSVLAVCGNLDRTQGGPSVNLNDGNNRRRTLYAAVSRHDLNATLRLFDFPDPNLTSEKRVVTTVPMQQLFVLNSDFIVRQAKSLVGRLNAEKLTEEGSRIELAYRILFQRSPNESEKTLGLSFLSATLPEGITADKVKLTAWEQYAQALLGTNEFVFVD
ncbi:MAG: PSD1 and planctomycete cytochrome C domain-containing protein [Planctomycetia bacterium]|nr:PSD1 and planctomycete cytochrome C domain-containing protein [Planctomycetia bacterium]